MATRPFPAISVRRALRAARSLAANPDDLPQVFALIEALSGKTILRVIRRMAASPSGQRVLSDQPDIVGLLADREALRRLPEGSLGRAYLAFVESENISAEGIRAAERVGRDHWDVPPAVAFVQSRMRDTHDVWHAATGYRGDVLGETALLAFTLAQTWNPAIALLVLVGLYKTRRWPSAPRTIADGFRRGWKAGWLPAASWETLLALPLGEVRRQLALEGAPHYLPLRTADYARAA
jgi:ubiquinone biosynthesis protein COQ4